MKIFTHFWEDPNAKYHVTLGFLSALCVKGIVIGLFPEYQRFSGLIGSLCFGVLIELKQRWDRREKFNFFGKKQNSVQESLLDIWATFCGGIITCII